MKTLLFISNPGNNESAGRYSREDAIFIPLNHESKLWLNGVGITPFELDRHLAEIDNDKIAKDIFLFLFKLENEKFFNGKSLIELISYDNISLWWALRRPFYHWVLESAKAAKLVRAILNTEKPQSVITDEEGIFADILKTVCEELKVPFTQTKHSKGLLKNVSKKLQRAKDIAQLYFVTSLRILQGYIRILKYKKEKNKPNIFILTNSFYWQLTRDVRTGKTIKDDVHFGALARLLKKNGFGVIIADLPKKTNTAWTSFKEKKYPFIPWEFFLINGFIDKDIRKKLKSLRRDLSDKWIMIDSNDNFRNSMNYSGIDMWKLYNQSFYDYFHKPLSSLASFYRNIEIAKKIISDCNIGLCIVTDELGSGLHFIIASRISGIKSAGMQHGIFGENSPTIRYGKDEISYNGLELGKCLLPDFMIVYGEHFKNLLARNNYLENSIVVCGNPRLDVAYHRNKIYSKKGICRKYGIDASNRIVMLATSRNENKFESLPIVENVYNAISNIKNVHLIHKLHPSEQEDVAEYKMMIKALGINVTLLRENVDLYEIIHASDIVVSWLATSVVAESLAFEKPVVTIDLGAKIDALGYKSADVVINVEDKSKLKEVIEYALNNKDKIAKEQAQRRQKFIKERFNKIDGRINERLFEFTKSILSDNNAARIQIREARYEDATKLSELVTDTIKSINSKHSSPAEVKVWLNRNTPDAIRNKLKDKSRRNFVAVLDGTVVGYATFSENKILNLYVGSNLTRKGIGRALLDFMENSMKKEDSKIVVLDSTLAALEFYRKNGYKKIKDAYNDVDGVRFHSISMGKDL